jgi:hypothetical protein
MRLPITDVTARAFALEWIGAWNSRDVDRVAAHYAPGVQTRESVRRRTSEPSFRLVLHDVFRGEQSIVVEYDEGAGADRVFVAETLEFGDDGKITRATYHSRPGGPQAA